MSSVIPILLQIVEAKKTLDTARRNGDALQIELAEAALNDLLDRSHVSHLSHTTTEAQ